MRSPPTARARARAELTAEITAIARRHLGEVGAGALSVRGVARELGMAPSAIYRYFASRDALLTTLIVDAYDALGEAVERAEGDCDRQDFGGRWSAAGRATRAWALAEPHQYALVYGSPVPGYSAPPDTIAPASRVALVLGAILLDAAAAGQVRPPLPTSSAATSALDPSLLELVGGTGVDVAATVQAWSALFGLVSFELFGHLDHVVVGRDDYFDEAHLRNGWLLGLPVDPGLSRPGPPGRRRRAAGRR